MHTAYINKLVSQSPFLIGQLVSYACETITIARLERCINTLTFSPEQLKNFENICAKHEQIVIKEWPDVWKTELTFTLAIANLKTLNELMHSAPYSYPYIKHIPKKYRMTFYYYSGESINDLIPQLNLIKEMTDIPVDIYVKRKLKLEKIRDRAKISKGF